MLEQQQQHSCNAQPCPAHKSTAWHADSPHVPASAVANLLGEAIWRVYNATSVAAIRE